jgi:diguanylate cyclase (GGDEF)-like protein
VYEDQETDGGPASRRRFALPLATADTFFGFIVASRRGKLSLSAQQLRLAEGLAKIAAGALDKARLLEREHLEAERIAFLSRLQKALAGLSDSQQVARVAVGEIAARFSLDLCTIKILPASELPAGAATYARPDGGIVPGDGVPEALLRRLGAAGTYVALPDVLADPDGASLAPAPAILRRLSRPIGLIGVPILVHQEVAGVLAGVVGGRTGPFDSSLVRSFDAVAAELGHALEAARTLLRERESSRFLDRLREAQRTMTTTFDAARIKQTLAEQTVALLKVDAAHVWDADPEHKTYTVSVRSGPAYGCDVGASVSASDEKHPVGIALRKGLLILLGDQDVAALHPELSGVAGARAAATPLLYGDQPAGALSVVTRAPTDPADEMVSRLALLADVGAVALHNARTMKLLEQQTERDPLTGLYRKDAVLRRLDAEIRRAERTGRAVAIANVRLDGLADAIQRLGPSFGDALLPKAAAQLVHVTRAGNLVGRDRSDRFLIVLFDANRVQAQKAADAIQKTFDGGFDPRLESSGIKFTLTVGLAAYPEDAFDAPSLVLRAEEALDDAVRAGPGSLVLYGALSADETGPTM